MKRLTQNIFLLFIIISITAGSGCKKENVAGKSFGVFTSQNDSTAVMNGTIGSKTPKHWDKYIAAYPNTRRIIMQDCPGSKDDDANLEVARKVRQQKVTIHLPGDAEIASGAVDFYLAGVTRTRDAGSRIGVHAWSEGNTEATEFARGHEKHLPYINYYKEMGFSQAEAEAFYYFTIEAASAANIHWMTETEIEQFQLATR